MMLLVDLERGSRGRLWFGEPPNVPIVPGERLQVIIHGVRAISPLRPHTLGIEIFMAIPVRPLYGLLGAIYTPAETDSLAIDVAFTRIIQDVAPGTLASRFHAVNAGLIIEYATHVIRVAENLLGNSGLAGTLEFKWAAHSPLYSSPIIFCHLAKKIIEILLADDETRLRVNWVEFLRFRPEDLP